MSWHGCTWNWRCLFIQFPTVSPGVSYWLQTTLTAGGSNTARGILYFGCVSFQILSWFKAGTSSRTLEPIVILPHGAHICNTCELIIIFSLVLKIIFKWEWLPHQLKELKRQSKVLELFPNQCNSHIPLSRPWRTCAAAVGRAGGGISFLLSVLIPRRFEIRTEGAPGAALTGNCVLA